MSEYNVDDCYVVTHQQPMRKRSKLSTNVNNPNIGNHDNMRMMQAPLVLQPRAQPQLTVIKSEFSCEFESKSWREDTTLIVDGQLLYVSSSILSLLSPVFTRMFEEQLAINGPLEFELRGHRHGAVLEFLKCIYPNIIKKVTMENVFTVLPLAAEFGVRQLMNSCEAVLIENTGDRTNTGDIFRFLAKAWEFNMDNLRKECLAIAATKSYADLAEAEKTCLLPLKAKTEIQSYMIGALERKLECFKENSTKCLQYDQFFKAANLNGMLSEHKTLVEMKTPRVCYLEYIFKVPCRNTKERSPSVLVHGLRWNIMVDTYKKDKIGVFLQVYPADIRFGWKCSACIQFSLHNYFNSESSICKSFVKTFDGEGRGYSNFVEMKRVVDPREGFLQDGSAKIEAYFIAEQPVFK